jgi:hypothetical protein
MGATHAPPAVAAGRAMRSGACVRGFWGAFAQLPTPDALQRLRCYDDNMVDPSGSSNAAGYPILSLLFIYVLFFLSSLVYVLYILLIRNICHHAYTFIFWIKIICKLPNFQGFITLFVLSLIF